MFGLLGRLLGGVLVRSSGSRLGRGGDSDFGVAVRLRLGCSVAATGDTSGSVVFFVLGILYRIIAKNHFAPFLFLHTVKPGR